MAASGAARRRALLESPAMCFDLDSEPPIPPIAGAAVSHEDLVLEASDGNRFAAFHAGPDERGGAGVVILPDVRGLYRFYTELAFRFAERGHHAVVIDYFGRTAGIGRRDDDFPYMEHVRETRPEQIQADVAAAVAHLRTPAGGACSAVFSVGFCFGGRNAWLAAADHDLAGAIGFYGMPGERDGVPGPAQRASELRAPILALMGGADQAISREEIERFERALAEAGVEHEVVMYDGAPHSFFDRKYDEFADAASDAWSRVLAFVEQHAKRPAATGR
jgi:carboxymethylenebutenolidase